MIIMIWHTLDTLAVCGMDGRGSVLEVEIRLVRVGAQIIIKLGILVVPAVQRVCVQMLDAVCGFAAHSVDSVAVGSGREWGRRASSSPRTGLRRKVAILSFSC